MADGTWFVLFPSSRAPTSAEVREALTNVMGATLSSSSEDGDNGSFTLQYQKQTALRIKLDRRQARVAAESKTLSRYLRCPDVADAYLRACDARFVIRYDRKQVAALHPLLLRTATRLRRLTGGAIVDRGNMALIQLPEELPHTDDGTGMRSVASGSLAPPSQTTGLREKHRADLEEIEREDRKIGTT